MNDWLVKSSSEQGLHWQLCICEDAKIIEMEIEKTNIFFLITFFLFGLLVTRLAYEDLFPKTSFCLESFYASQVVSFYYLHFMFKDN